MDTATRVRISWNLIEPYDQDAQFLKIIRREWADPEVTLGSWYWTTTDGWRRFEGFDVLDATAIPHAAGAELDAVHDWWQAPLSEVLKAEGFGPGEWKRSGSGERAY